MKLSQRAIHIQVISNITWIVLENTWPFESITSCLHEHKRCYLEALFIIQSRIYTISLCREERMDYYESARNRAIYRRIL